MVASNTFITNDKTKILKSRLNQLISCSQELKFLVGFFYFSGLNELYTSLKDNPDVAINILVGLNVDKLNYELVECGKANTRNDAITQVQGFQKSLLTALNTDEFDTAQFYEQASFFIAAIIDNRLNIRKTREPNHAKFYFFKGKQALQGWQGSKFITGSSNLTRAGLSKQSEFNVEIGDYGTKEAEDYFDDLWDTATKITENPDFRTKLLQALTNRTHPTEPTPYEVYAFILKTFLDLQLGIATKEHVLQLLKKSGYKEYRYQTDAVAQILGTLEHYQGVLFSSTI